jgi:hypothetical protein
MDPRDRADVLTTLGGQRTLRLPDPIEGSRRPLRGLRIDVAGRTPPRPSWPSVVPADRQDRPAATVQRCPSTQGRSSPGGLRQAVTPPAIWAAKPPWSPSACCSSPPARAVRPRRTPVDPRLDHLVDLRRRPRGRAQRCLPPCPSSLPLRPSPGRSARLMTDSNAGPCRCHSTTTIQPGLGWLSR